MKGTIISRNKEKTISGKYIDSFTVSGLFSCEGPASAIYDRYPIGQEVLLSRPTDTKKLFGGMLSDENGNSIYIKEVIYNDPATIVFWSDGTKTTSKCQKGDIYSPEVGLILAVLKKITSGDFVATLLEDWIPEGKTRVTLKDVRKKYRNK